jgi:hypothetical protein
VVTVEERQYGERRGRLRLDPVIAARQAFQRQRQAPPHLGVRPGQDVGHAVGVSQPGRQLGQ